MMERRRNPKSNLLNILSNMTCQLNITSRYVHYLVISFLYVCMVNTIYLFSFVETPRQFIIAELSIRKLGSSSVLILLTDVDPSLRIESSAIINLRGVSTKLNEYNIIYSVIVRILGRSEKLQSVNAGK